jgi:hypothetical protein
MLQPYPQISDWDESENLFCRKKFIGQTNTKWQYATIGHIKRQFGATTITIMAFCITTLTVTINKFDTRHNNTYHHVLSVIHAECHVLLIVMLGVIILNTINLIVISPADHLEQRNINLSSLQ